MCLATLLAVILKEPSSSCHSEGAERLKNPNGVVLRDCFGALPLAMTIVGCTRLKPRRYAGLRRLEGIEYVFYLICAVETDSLYYFLDDALGIDKES